MFTIFLKGHFETKNQKEFLNKLQEILTETDTTYFGEVQSYQPPIYIDFETKESTNGESETTAEEPSDKTV